MAHLVPCPGCSRHVRAGEASCPFCASPLTLVAVEPPRTPKARLGRAATFAFGAAVVTTISVTGCSESSSPGGNDSGTRVDARIGEEDGGPAPLYGAPPDSGARPDAGSASPDSGPPATDAGGPVPAYGAPAPIDGGGGQLDSGGGGAVPLYGGPPGD